MLRGKGIYLSLFWNFVVLVVFHYLTVTHHSNEIPHTGQYFSYSGWCFFPVVMICYPIVGWLADTYIGRYKTIRCGLWVMWVVSILLAVLSLGTYKRLSISNWWTDGHSQVTVFLIVVKIVLFIALSVGLSLCQANIIQFGVDQLTGASSADVISYTNWYTFTYFASELVINFTLKCVWSYYEVPAYLVLPVLLTLALLSDLFFGKYLVIEPKTGSPFKLLYGVLKYAHQHKYPRLRSAFTYWNDQRYSRIDLAKTKYGGPYSTEEVENVKAFFRILSIVCIMSSFIGIGFSYEAVFNHSLSIYAGEYRQPAACFQELSIHKLGTLFVIVFIPLSELVVRPIFSYWLLRFTSRSKFTAGIVSLLLMLVVYLIIFGNLPQPSCSLLAHGNVNLTGEISHRYTSIPKVLEAFAKIWLFGSALEFICAQCPYSMKGLLFGLMYAICSCFVVLAYVSFLPFHYMFPAINWNSVPMSCEFWFLVVCLVLYALLTACFVLLSVNYKKRERGEELPSEHCFAEEYYSQAGHVEGRMDDASSRVLPGGMVRDDSSMT